MSEEELQEVSENTKKYITTTLDKEADATLIGKYNRVLKIGGFGNRDVIEAGIANLVTSEKYQKALQEIKSELGE